MPIRRRTALAALLSPGIARAQGWPMRPIRLTVPFPPGGAADVAARLLAEALAPLGAPWVIDNRPGGNTAIGAEAVARSAPDGHSFLFCSNSTMASVPLLMASPPYDPARDFAAVALVSRAPFFLFVPASLGITDVAGFLALARAQPGALTYGSNGNGTAGHLGMEWLKQATGIDLLHVPYRSYVQALNDMLGGRIQAMLADLTVVAGAVEAGRVRALAAAVPERSGFFAELPTVAEAAGIPGFDAGVWFGLFAPAGLRADIVTAVSDAAAAWLALPASRAALGRIGQVPAPESPAGLARLVREDGARYARLIRSAGIRLE